MDRQKTCNTCGEADVTRECKLTVSGAEARMYAASDLGTYTMKWWLCDECTTAEYLDNYLLSLYPDRAQA